MSADLGILFVHGIGEQPEGDTLLTCGEPLLKWLRQWLASRPDQGPPGAVTAVSTELTPSKSRSGVPAHSVVRVETSTSAGAPTHQTWVLAECWWGGEVRRPAFSKLARWMLTTGAWMILSHGFRQGRPPASGAPGDQRSLGAYLDATARGLRVARVLAYLSCSRRSWSWRSWP